MKAQRSIDGARRLTPRAVDAESMSHWSARRRTTSGMANSPLHHRAHDSSQVFAFIGERVLETRRVLTVLSRCDDAVLGQPFQSIRKEIRPNTLRPLEKLGEATLPVHQIPHDE